MPTKILAIHMTPRFQLPNFLSFPVFSARIHSTSSHISTEVVTGTTDSHLRSRFISHRMTLRLAPFITARIPGDVGVRDGASLGSWSLYIFLVISSGGSLLPAFVSSFEVLFHYL